MRPADLPPEVLALIDRHYRGAYRHNERVQARLDEIFRTSPPDAVDRLKRAADYLKVKP